MSDAADEAFYLEQEAIRAGLAAKAKQSRGLPYTGLCHNCDEPVEKPRAFCDEDCRDDFELRAERKKVNFKV
jgi:hypothetical protein